MKNRVIPNKEVTLRVYALYYKTGSLFLKSSDNSNKGIDEKNTNTIKNNVELIASYNYEEAVNILRRKLLEYHDLFVKDVKIIDYTVKNLSDIFDEAFELFGEKEFKETEESS